MGSHFLIYVLSTVKRKKWLALAPIDIIGDGMENREISILDNGYSALHE